MNLAQIRAAHKDKWVLIEYRELDRNLEVVDGDVIAEAATKEEIYTLQMTVGPGKKLAIRYCGDWPADVAVMFWLRAALHTNTQMRDCHSGERPAPAKAWGRNPVRREDPPPPGYRLSPV